MTRILSETRSYITALENYLDFKEWLDIEYTEGWTEIDLENPLVNVYIIDEGKETLEIGQPTNHKLFKRTIQVDVYMESEQRVGAMCEDIMDFMDVSVVQIQDWMTTSGIGYMVLPRSEDISTVFFPPELNHPEILRWRGIVRGNYESYYPNGGGPI